MTNHAAELHHVTPLLYSDPISRVLGKRVYLKIESLQPSASFKNRGIGHYCATRAKEGAKAFVSSSGGNAGIAAAYAARQLGIPITVIVPHGTDPRMLEKIRAQDAEVIMHGKDWQEADQRARALCDETGACYVSPFDHPLIWKGHSTLIHEVADAGLKPGAVVLSVGGGGLFCGVALGMKDVGWNDVPIYAVETEGADSLAASLKAGERVEIDAITSIAKSLGARAVTPKCLRWAEKRPVCSKIVSDQAAVEACHRLAEDHRLVVEPACGASLSLCYDRDKDLQECETILVVVCGGNFTVNT